MRNVTDWLRMSSSENPLATKRHKNRHKREALRMAQKGKGRCAKKLGHIGQQESGEGGILGRLVSRHERPNRGYGLSPPDVSTAVARAFAVRATGLPADFGPWTAVGS